MGTNLNTVSYLIDIFLTNLMLDWTGHMLLVLRGADHEEGIKKPLINPSKSQLSIHCYQETCKNKAKDFHSSENNLRRSLKLKHFLQLNPTKTHFNVYNSSSF